MRKYGSRYHRAVVNSYLLKKKLENKKKEMCPRVPLDFQTRMIKLMIFQDALEDYLIKIKGFKKRKLALFCAQ